MVDENILFLSRNKVDISKYNTCIEQSNQTTIYAYSWYLDIVSDDWGVLVLGDYKAVMPIPLMRSIRNFYFKKIAQPPFCQQLGLFYSEEISGDIVLKFLEMFYDKKPNSYQFNAKNLIKNKLFEVSNRKNYELELKDSYELLKKNYSKNLVRNIKKATNNELKIVANVGSNIFIEMKTANKKHQIKQRNLRKMKLLIDELIARNFGEIYGVQCGTELIATAVISKNKERIVHLFSASSEIGKKMGAIPYLFDFLIQENCGSNFVFDFEGGSIPSIARFNKSFGAKSVDYFLYSKAV